MNEPAYTHKTIRFQSVSRQEMIDLKSGHSEENYRMTTPKKSTTKIFSNISERRKFILIRLHRIKEFYIKKTKLILLTRIPPQSEKLVTAVMVQ